MFLFVMGLPGRFAEWCDRTAARLLGGEAGSAPLFAADTLEQLSLGVLRTGSSRAVISSRRPSGALRQALLKAERPFLVALEDPRNALIDLVVRQGLSLPDAVQIMAGSCAAFASEERAPNGLVLHANTDAHGTVTAMANHFGLSGAEDAIAASMAEYAGDAAQHDAAAWWGSLSQDQRATVAGALAAYLDRRPGSGALTVTWTHDLFFAGDPSGERATGPIDITGRAHCVLQGPNILVPPGRWALSLGLQVSRDAADREFSVEVLTDHPVATGMIRPGHPAVDLNFSIEPGAEHPVCIRISTVRAAFDGTIAVETATMNRAVGPEAAATGG